MKTFSIKSAVASMVLLLVSATRTVPAAEPEPQLRYFALPLPAGSTPDDIPDLCPDLEDSGSKLLVVLPSDPNASTGDAMNFMSGSAQMSGEPPETFECDGAIFNVGEDWLRSSDVTFASSRGSQTLTLFWKDELPPPGALAFIGPVDGGGHAVFFDWFWIRPGNSGDTNDTFCDPYAGHWFASKEQTASSVLVRIGVGLFSK